MLVYRSEQRGTTATVENEKTLETLYERNELQGDIEW